MPVSDIKAVVFPVSGVEHCGQQPFQARLNPRRGAVAAGQVAVEEAGGVACCVHAAGGAAITVVAVGDGDPIGIDITSLAAFGVIVGSGAVAVGVGGAVCKRSFRLKRAFNMGYRSFYANSRYLHKTCSSPYLMWIEAISCWLATTSSNRTARVSSLNPSRLEESPPLFLFADFFSNVTNQRRTQESQNERDDIDINL